MERLIPLLFAHERRALREALHRDACRELKRAASDHEWAEWHEYNARQSRRLLKLIESCSQ